MSLRSVRSILPDIGTIVLTGSSAVARAVVKLVIWIHDGLMICVINTAA